MRNREGKTKQKAEISCSQSTLGRHMKSDANHLKVLFSVLFHIFGFHPRLQWSRADHGKKKMKTADLSLCLELDFDFRQELTLSRTFYIYFGRGQKQGGNKTETGIGTNRLVVVSLTREKVRVSEGLSSRTMCLEQVKSQNHKNIKTKRSRIVLTLFGAEEESHTSSVLHTA